MGSKQGGFFCCKFLCILQRWSGSLSGLIRHVVKSILFASVFMLYWFSQIWKFEEFAVFTVIIIVADKAHGDGHDAYAPDRKSDLGALRKCITSSHRLPRYAAGACFHQLRLFFMKSAMFFKDICQA